MIDVSEEFGFNAGRIWTVLKNKGPLTKNQLIEETSLRENEVSAAVGWLARENKIRQEGDVFCLDVTNLTFKIGGNAGKIWNALHSNGEIDTNNISKFVDIDESETFSALGWLARENKIHLKRKK